MDQPLRPAWRAWETRVAQVGRTTRGGWALTFGTLAVMLTTVWVRQQQATFPGPALLIATVAAWAPLLLRTRAPLIVLGATVAIESAHLAFVPVVDTGLTAAEAMGVYQPVPIATMVAAWTVASRAPRWIGWVAGSVSALVLLAVALVAHPLDLLATDLVMANLVVIATGAGVGVAAWRDRVDREEREREDRTRRAVIDERLRIARELHDVLAHNLTLVNAQASVAEYLMHQDADAAAEALRGISRHTAQAITDLRATVGLLRRDGEDEPAGEDRGPVPGLARLAGLVDDLASTGAEIELEVSGAPVELDELADLAAYRIVQEALTNAMKHAPDAPVTVRLAWTDGGLEIRVVNAAPPRPAGPAPGTGHGLLGMRERARAAGGTFTVSQESGGSFSVAASLPAPGRSRAAAGDEKGTT
ncbi:sensor histidine kinase [Actinotalea sp. M2MS4P-6]|uniref:sensor histidine kinase n=1 Tax=Actinotalea sp. M2MS4P-6 TaxID=2983762 RepID=UPI0021E3D4DA|nr:sensor histidine kinase [Actinotalea sp. M2MS4P-6]MCV2395692.1 sensor histidine kinase [Actinotalea sp. M2MS4P-6]